MRRIDWNESAGAARANPAIALLLLGAVVAILVTLLNRDDETGGDARTGARYVEQALSASAIDPALVRWEEVVAPIEVPMEHPVALASSPDGRIVVAGNRLVHMVPDRPWEPSTAWEVECSDPLPEAYGAVSVDPLERVLATTDNRTDFLAQIDEEMVWEGELDVLHSWGYADRYSDVELTSIASNGREVFLADALGKRVLRHPRPCPPPSGEPAPPAELLASGFNVPSTMDLTITPEGELVTVDPGRFQIQVRDVYGDVVRSFGEGGTRIEQFFGCCNPIAVAVLSDGRFVTAEKGLGVTRVKVYTPSGELDSVVAGPGAFDEPISGPPMKLDVAVDSKDRILVLDPVRKQVRIFTPKQEGEDR